MKPNTIYYIWNINMYVKKNKEKIMKKKLLYLLLLVLTLPLFAPSTKNKNSNYKENLNFPSSFEEAEKYMDSTFTNVDDNLKVIKINSNLLVFKKDSI